MIKLQVGHCYITRDKHIVAVTKKNDDRYHGIVIYAKNLNYSYCWHENGSLDLRWESSFDIVEEISETTEKVPCNHLWDDRSVEASG